jgi:replicative DNA helicase
MTNKVMPHSYESEQQVLGCILLDEKSCDSWEYIEPEHFYYPPHKEIFTAMLLAKKITNQIDPVLVFAHLDQTAPMQVCEDGTPMYGRTSLEHLLSLANEVLSIKHYDAYCEVLHERAILRQLISIFEKLSKDASDSSNDVLDLITRATQSIAGIKDLDEESQKRLEIFLEDLETQGES